MHYLAYVDILVFKQHTVLLILTTYLKAGGHEGAAVNLFSLISKCRQQDAEKSKTIICSIGDGCGASKTFISCDVCVLMNVLVCLHIDTTLHS